MLTLDARPELRAHALGEFSRDPRIELGTPVVTAYPAVLDTLTSEEGITLVQSLEATAGVLRVAVVAIDYTCDDAASDSVTRSPR